MGTGRLFVVDTPFLLWRAFYAGARRDPERAVAIALREIGALSEAFGEPVYCFDSKPYRRTAVFPGYKSGREKSVADAATEAAKTALRERAAALVDELRERHGAARVYSYAGYEADDHAAAVCARPEPGARYTVCSRDRDLLQVIRPRVDLYDPVTKELWTLARFRAEFHGLHPTQWPLVKALAGCESDSVPGAGGVGEATAVRHVAGALNALSATALKIREFMKTPEYARNVLLCTLPFPGTPSSRISA